MEYQYGPRGEGYEGEGWVITWDLLEGDPQKWITIIVDNEYEKLGPDNKVEMLDKRFTM